MKASTYTKGYRKALDNSRTLMIANAAMAVALAFVSLLAFKARERIVLVPPVIEDRMEVAYKSANKTYYESYALYVATFLGNINPGNSEFVATALQMSFSPALYTTMQQDIREQAEQLRMTSRSLRFFPDRVIYEGETRKTFVTGTQEIVSSSGNVREQQVVFEMIIAVASGLPRVDKFTFYEGSPKTLDWIAKHGGNTSGN